MGSFQIPIGTSDPVDLSKGLALIPSLGSVRAGISASSRSYKLLDVPILIICVRLKLRVYGGYGFGIVGPAVAFLGKGVSVTRTNINNLTEGQLSLVFSEGMRMQAGCFVQSYVAAGVSATLQYWKPDPWYRFWVGKWKDAFTIEKDFRIDILDLLLKLIEFLLAKKPNPSSFKKDLQNKLSETNLDVNTYGFDMAGSSTTVTPNLRATPEVTATINLANYVPKLREMNLALAKVDGGISIGPTAHLQMPVTLNLTGFTVEGGILGRDASADYGPVDYVSGNRVTAKGKTLFNTQEIPTRFTTNVRYETTISLAISIHTSIKVAKFFKISLNTPSLDLINLLFRRQIPGLPVDNQVSTAVRGGCVLTPNMTLRFVGPGGSLEIKTGEVGTGTVTLAGLVSTVFVTVSLEIQPPVPTFPTSVTLPPGTQSAKFLFRFQNQCLLTGNRSDPSEMEAPSPISAIQTYSVRARLLQPPQDVPCGADYQAVTPLSITNRFIRCQRYKTEEGPAPPWDSLAGVTIKADIDDPRAPSGGAAIFALLWFPYAANEPPQTVPVTFTLLDENREPYLNSGVELIIGQQRGDLAPSQTFNVRLLTTEESQNPPGQNANIFIHWKRKGPHSGYGNRFFLLINAGCQFGQTEFWMDVFNWS